MNLWILKYDTQDFSNDYIERLENYVQTIPQLDNNEHLKFKKENFYFLSFHSDGIPKSYNQIEGSSFKGYSGLLIDKSAEQIDVRNIANLNTEAPNLYYGQFALYQLRDHFSCFADNFGFHKVFYGEKNGVKYVSNSFEFLRKLGVFETNILQMLKDMATVRFGIFPGYNTLLKNVYTLPEYGKLELLENGDFKVGAYKNINELLNPSGDFETKLKETVKDYQTIAAYLRKYHQITIGLSGGFDGRLVLNMFHGTNGKSLETFTYNRAGNLDLIIAGILSRKAGVPHRKFKLNPIVNTAEIKVSGFKESDGDAFAMSYKNALQGFFKSNGEFKVSLGGNGGDTDWEFGEKRIADVDKSNIQNFIRDYSKKLTAHPILNKELENEFAQEVESYFLEKYSLFGNKSNWQQLLASAFFHLERFRGEQGFIYSQNSNKSHDVFAPFAIESFNQLLFLATKDELQRGLRKGIQYRLSYELTGGKIPYAPILTSANEHGNNIFQKGINKLAPYLPKIIWKLNNGDTNARIRNLYEAQVNEIYRNYINQNTDSEIFQYIDKDAVLKGTSKSDYQGNYNAIGSMIKTLNENQSL